MRVNVARAFAPLLDSQTAGAGPGAALDAERLWAALQTDPHWRDWQEGRITPRQWHEHLIRRLKIALSFEEFCGAWNRALEPETILDETLFEDLGRRSSLALLSNTDPLHAEHLDRHFTFGRHFSARIYSCRVGMSKPSQAIYQAALDALGLAPSEALYIDDVPEFVQAARAIGVDTIRFENPRKLIGDLRQRGILPS